MTVEELVSLLGEFEPEAEVRIAHQPGWPFEYEVADVDIRDNADPDNPEVVYVIEGRQIGYLPHEVAVAIGWAEPEEAT